MSDNATAQVAQATTSLLPIIIPVITFILGLLGKIVYDLWHESYLDNKQRRKEALKKHFTVLKENYIKPTSEFLLNVSNRDGILVSDATETSNSIDLAKTTWPTQDNNKLFQCFKAHFPDEANALLMFEKDVKENNERNRTLNTEIISLLEKKTNIQVNNYNKQITSGSPYFPALVILFIRNSFKECWYVLHSRTETNKRSFDFSEIQFAQSNFFKDKIEVCLKDGRTLAVVNNLEEAGLCKQALIEVVEDVNLKNRLQLFDAKSDVNLSKFLSNNLDTISEMYSNYSSILKKEGKCPICKLIH